MTFHPIPGRVTNTRRTRHRQMNATLTLPRYLLDPARFDPRRNNALPAASPAFSGTCALAKAARRARGASKRCTSLLFLGSFRVYFNTRRASVGALLLPLIGEMQNTESQDKLMSGRPDAREKEKKNEARAGISALFGPGKHATLLET